MTDEPGSDAAGADIDTALSALAQEIIELMLQEHRHIDRELDGVSKLISDASRTLLHNFNQINAVCDRLDDGSCEQDIQRGRQEIVTVMQFDDIVQQLTRHAQRRTQHILGLFEKLAHSIEQMQGSGFEYTTEFGSRIRELRQDTEELRRELEKQSPVKQDSLSTGKSEIF